MIERSVRVFVPTALAVPRALVPLTALMLIAAATPAPAPAPIAWEPAARELHTTRRGAESALHHAAEGGDREAAALALEAMLAAADRHLAAAESMSARLSAKGMPPAALDRHAAYLSVHKSRRQQLAPLVAMLRSPRSAAAARSALAILAEASQGPARDPAASIAVRHVRRIAPRASGANFADLDDVRLDGSAAPQDLAAPAKEISAAAERLPADPAKIAAWVRAEIEDVPFHASAIGAAGCLRDRRCGAFDSASLLAALLRAKRIPARLVYGVVEADASVVAHGMLGGGSRQELVDAMHLGGVPVQDAGTARVRFEHVWVRTRASTAAAWTDLDPVLDPAPVAPPPLAAPSVALAASADPAALLVRYLGDRSDRTPFGADFLPKPVRSVPKKSAPAPAAKKPAPPVVVFRAADLAGVPAAHRSYLGLTAGRTDEAPWIDVRVPLEDAQATGVLFYPAPPSELDDKIAKALGGARSPPHLTTATTRVAAGGREIAALPPLAWGSVVPLTITLFPPNGNPLDVHGSIQTGAPAALTIAPHAPGAGWLPARWRLADSDPTRGAGVARFCAAVGAQFFADLLDETARLATRAGGRRFVSPSTVLVAGQLDAPSGLARSPLFADANGLAVDVGRLDQQLLPAAGSQPVAFEVASGAALSAWEARALEIGTGLPAASTVTAAKAAAAAGGAPKILRGTPAAADLAAISPSARSEIRRSLATGLVAVLPRTPQSLGGWIGESYVLLDPRSGRGAYLLRGTLRGAITTERCGMLLDPIRDGGDAGATLAGWRRGRAERALLAREGWPAGVAATKPTGVATLVGASASRERAEPLAVSPWPPVGGKAKALPRGQPIALSGVGTVLWLGRGSRVLDPAAAATLGKTPPAGFDPKTRLWVGPSALAIVPVDGEPRLLPIPARY